MSVCSRRRDGWLPRLRGGLAVLAVLIVALAAASSALAEERVALVMWLSAYQGLHERKNPRNYAADISEALKQQGFEVLFGEDLDLSAMRDLIRKFTTLSRDADVSLFYYAGHGLSLIHI